MTSGEPGWLRREFERARQRELDRAWRRITEEEGIPAVEWARISQTGWHLEDGAPIPVSEDDVEMYRALGYVILKRTATPWKKVP